jgi:hypothetical protein
LNARQYSISECKTGLILEVTSLEGDSSVVFYYLGASEIWPDKRGGLLVRMALKEQDYCIIYYL